MYKDIGGQRFGRLVVLRREGKRARQWQWLCVCDCGNKLVVDGAALRRTVKPSRSCGCLQAEVARKTFTTHGAAVERGPEYIAWANMNQRCSNAAHPQWENYGGRGITVCEEWRHCFVAFYEYVGPRPGSEYSIDRTDNNGNYEPGNVRWATRKVQNNNQRKRRKRVTNPAR